MLSRSFVAGALVALVLCLLVNATPRPVERIERAPRGPVCKDDECWPQGLPYCAPEIASKFDCDTDAECIAKTEAWAERYHCAMDDIF